MIFEEQTERMMMYTTEEAANLLKISTSKLRKMVSAGEIEPVRVGSRTLFTDECLSKWLPRKSVNADVQTIVNLVIEQLAGIELPGGAKFIFKGGI